MIVNFNGHALNFGYSDTLHFDFAFTKSMDFAKISSIQIFHHKSQPAVWENVI
jgi:hypothetical protein